MKVKKNPTLCFLVAIATTAGAVLHSTQSDKNALVDRLKKEGDCIDILAVKVFPCANNTRTIFDGRGKAADELEEARVGDKITVYGHWVLRTSVKETLSFKLSHLKKYTQPLLVPLPSIEVKKGEGDFQLSCVVPREGNFFLAFLSIPEGRPFPGSYLVTSVLPAKTTE